MIAFILNLLRQHWLGVAEIILLAALAVQHVEIGHLRNRMAGYREENRMLSDSNRRLSGMLAKQNQAIFALQNEAERKSRAAARSLAHARISMQRRAFIAEKLKARKMTGDECADVLMLLNNYFK